MDIKTKKYIDIEDWNYWWCVYQCGKDWEPPNWAEFSLRDNAEKDEFFHFDFYNISSLENILQEEDFIEPESADYPEFLDKSRKLIAGKLEWFVGALYYPNYTVDFYSCNQLNNGLLNKMSPPIAPYYAVVFINEKRQLIPDVLTEWMEKLSEPLFKYSFSCEVVNVPTQAETMKVFEKEFKKAF